MPFKRPRSGPRRTGRQSASCGFLTHVRITCHSLQDKGAIQAAKKRAEELGARIEYASKHDLNMVADNRPHQVRFTCC